MALTTALAAAAVGDAELSLLLCDDETIAGLHEQYLGLPGPTDVLSFPQHTLQPGQLPPDGLLGDVVVSVDTAARQAAPFADWSLADELLLLAIHGLLHLCGYDDQSAADRQVMQAREDALLTAAGRRPAPREVP